MSLPSIHTSKEAAYLESKYFLRDFLFSIPTLQLLTNKLSTYYETPEIEVRFSKNLGNGNGRTKILGKVRISSDGNKGKRQVIPIDITLGPLGRTLATLIHEFAHYLQICEKGYSNHHNPWKRIHERILRTFVDESIISFRTLAVEDRLNWFWDNMPSWYNHFWYPGIPGEELVDRLERLKARISII